jgi:hypothetical protein
VIIGSSKDGLPIILGNDTPVLPGANAPAGANGAPPPPPNSPPPSGPAGNKPPSGTSGEATPPASDQTASTAPASDEGVVATAPQVGLADVQAILSRLSGVLLPPGSGADTAAKPKQ